MLDSGISHQGNANENHIVIPLHTHPNGSHKTENSSKCWQRREGARTAVHGWRACKSVQSLGKMIGHMVLKLNTFVSILVQQFHFYVRIQQKCMGTCSHRHHQNAQSSKSQNKPRLQTTLQTPKYPPAVEWIGKLRNAIGLATPWQWE